MLESASRLPYGAAVPPFLRDLATRERSTDPASARAAATAGSTRDWLGAALDELDYAILVAVDGMHVVHLNEAARLECDALHPLQLLGSELKTRLSRDVAPLRNAVNAAANHGLRCLLTLGDDVCRITASIVPLRTQGAESGAVLIVLGKRAVCESLSLESFARSHHLTHAETRVLAALCAGDPPTEAAGHLGVAVCTVRTQIASIRQKTGAANIQSLVRQVAVLPPLKGILRRHAPTPATTRRGPAGLALAA
jgi:DNA-binding CsgD family transcriptional regulator